MASGWLSASGCATEPISMSMPVASKEEEIEMSRELEIDKWSSTTSNGICLGTAR